MIWSPTVNTGFRRVIGSWKIIAISPPRISRSSSSSELQEVPAVEQDLAAGELARRRVDQPHDRERGDALAAAGLAHERQPPAARIENDTPSTALTIPSITWK